MIELNNREIALLIWAGATLVFVLGVIARKPEVRQAAGHLVRAFFHYKILSVLVVATLYVVGCVWLLAELDIFAARNLKTVIVWGLTFAVVTALDLKKLQKGPRALSDLAKESVGATAIVVFVAGINTLPLWAELLVVPVLSFLTALLVVAQQKPEHAKVAGCLGTILGLAGIGILAYSVIEIITGLQKFETLHQAREFGIPILLSGMFLPFLYALMLVVGYEATATRLLFSVEDRSLRRYILWRGFLAFGLTQELFQRFARNIQIADVSDRDGVRNVIRELRRIRSREKNPPTVDFAEGWSPYDAREFLAEQGLRTNDYHRTAIDWSAESPMVDIGGETFPDRIIYRMAGTEAAVTRLSLDVHINTSDASEASDAMFWQTAYHLVLETLGGETADRFAATVGLDPLFSLKAGDFSISLRRDDWSLGKRGGYSRKITILHPANREPMFGLD